MGRRVFALLALGWGFTLIPPLIATMTFFPIFLDAGEGAKTVSLFACLTLVPALLPLWRALSRSLRSPAAWKVYLLLFLFFFLTERIAAEMVAVTFVGLLSSLIGAVFFRLARGRGGRDGARE